VVYTYSKRAITAWCSFKTILTFVYRFNHYIIFKNLTAVQVIYTGPIDAYFGYKLEALAYRGLRFDTEVLEIQDFQGNAVVNYTDTEIPYTSIIEHKHFEFGSQS
jgi:UDP-galactopyranose mutase